MYYSSHTDFSPFTPTHACKNCESTVTQVLTQFLTDYIQLLAIKLQ